MRIIKILFLLTFITLLGQAQNYIDRNHNGKMDPFENKLISVDKRVDDLMSRMTLDEKLGQMIQYTLPEILFDPTNPDAAQLEGEILASKNLIEKGMIGSLFGSLHLSSKETRKLIDKVNSWSLNSPLNIPLLIGTDAIHGTAFTIGATVFPVPLNIGATFDDELAQRIATATAKECTESGYNWTFSPNVEVARDMRWGRIDETFGEDPLVCARMGIAFVKGYQQDYKSTTSILSCAKHFFGGSESVDGRNHGPTDISQRTIDEVFIPPFKACIDAGVGSIMLAHNEVNGIPCHSDKHQITEVMKGDLKFDGFTVSDYTDVKRLFSVHKVVSNMAEAARLATNAGLDMNMFGPGFFEPVLEGMKTGEVDSARVKDAARRILIVKMKLGLFDRNETDTCNDFSGYKEYADLNLEAAQKSIVLLKNKANLLPLTLDKKIFVTGPFSDSENILGDWSGVQPHKNVVTVLEGIQSQFGLHNVNYFDCGHFHEINEEKINNAVENSLKSDVCVVVVGENPLRSQSNEPKTEGENVDRNRLQLYGNQLKLVKALIATGKPVVVVLTNGGPVAIPWISENADAILEAFYPGGQGGLAIGEIIAGKVNPSARLPYSIPRDVGYMNSWYYQRPSKFSKGQYSMTPKNDSMYPLYEFGYGLSFTTFEYSDISVQPKIKKGNNVEISVTVTNTGKFDGEEVVLLFVNDEISRVTTPVKLLKDYQRIVLKKGEKRKVSFVLKPEQLMFLNEQLKPELEPGFFTLMTGDKKTRFEVVK